MAGLTSTGWVPKTATELRTELEAAIRAELGDDVDVSAESVFGPLIAVCATKLAELWELSGAIYAARTPTGASGVALDAVGAICPGLSRRAATKGTVTLTVSLNNGVTVPAGSRAHVSGEPSNAWVTTEDVTNTSGSPSTLTVAAEALDAGRTPANAGAITVIATPVTGWTAVTNAADAVPGAPAQNDAAYRLSREQSLARNASSPVNAIAAQVLEVEGVTQCVVWENATAYTDADGRPPHSVEALVLGGDDEDVARAVFAAKAGGIQAYGTGSPVSFTDENGIARSVRFSRPTDLDAYATLILVVDPATYAGDTAAKSALAAAMEGLLAGEVARNSDGVVALRAVTGVIDAALFAGFTSSLAEQVRDNLFAPARSRLVFDTGRMDVTVSS